VVPCSLSRMSAPPPDSDDCGCARILGAQSRRGGGDRIASRLAEFFEAFDRLRLAVEPAWYRRRSMRSIAFGASGSWMSAAVMGMCSTGAPAMALGRMG